VTVRVQFWTVMVKSWVFGPTVMEKILVDLNLLMKLFLPKHAQIQACIIQVWFFNRASPPKRISRGGAVLGTVPFSV
jgi:hypothetical protein